jgi:hypothetical protein
MAYKMLQGPAALSMENPLMRASRHRKPPDLPEMVEVPGLEPFFPREAKTLENVDLVFVLMD